MSEMGYWFVSHCSKDIKIVEQIVDVLKDCGISYWKAPEMIPPGSNYAKEIPMALKNCSIFLFIVSKASQSSIWVEKELDSAVNARKKIIPVRIDDTPLSDMYTFYMNNIQMIDVRIQPDGSISKEGLEKLYTKFKESMPKNTINSESLRGSIKVSLSSNAVVTENASVIENMPVMENTSPIENTPVAEKVDIEDEVKRNKIDARTNALRINKVPVFCKKCGMTLEHVDVGTYRCLACNIEYYDDFQKIRNFIRDNGPAPAFVIARNTGVSKQTVEYYFSDDVKLSPTELDYSNPHVAKTRKQTNNSEGMWRSNIWKR